MGTLVIVLALVVLLIVAGASYGVYQLLNPTRTSRDRLAELTGGPKKEPGGDDELAERIQKRLAELATNADIDDADALQKQLIQAGFRAKNAPQLFNMARVVLALLMPILVSPLVLSSSLTTMAGAVFLASGFGYVMPQLIVTGAMDARKAELLNAFPDSLDLLVTCVEAGLALDAAIKRVAFEMEEAAPMLSTEMLTVTSEMSAGVARVDALKHFGERTGVDEIVQLVNMLVQADRFGTSIADSLRTHSEIVREHRMSRAEEKAAAVSPKLTVVMIMFLMPTLGIVLLGPAIINISELF